MMGSIGENTTVMTTCLARSRGYGDWEWEHALALPMEDEV